MRSLAPAPLAFCLALAAVATGGQPEPKAKNPAVPPPKQAQPEPKAKAPAEPAPKQAQPAGPEDPFEQLVLRVQADPGGATEKEVLDLLTDGQRLGRCHAASVAANVYLAQNFRVSPALWRLAAETAMLAGDFRTAASRYKAFATGPVPADEASLAAATLYTILADLLDAPDDLYQFMSAHGDKFRSQPAARKFDPWFLDQARRRRDYAAAARWLSLVYADQLPVEQERLYFGEYLDWLFREIVRGQDDQFAALPHCKKLLTLLRGDRRRPLLYAIHVANLEFKAGAAGKDKAALDNAFAPVAAAARAYLDAFPSAATVKEIVHAFTDGGVADRLDGSAWNRQFAPKSSFFVQAFDALPDPERQALLEWRLPQSGHVAPWLANAEQWADLGAKHAGLFRRTPAIRHLPFVTRPATRDLYRKQAQFLQGVPSRAAAVINAMAASDDLLQAIEHLVRNESWHLQPKDALELFEAEMWPAYKALAEKAGAKLPADARDRAIAHLGAELARTPGALDPRSAEAFLECAWECGTGPNREDKAKMLEHIASLQWVPFDRRERKEIFGKLLPRFRTWADWVRREARAKAPKIASDLAGQIVPLEEAIRRAADQGGPDPSKAPNPLCQALALTLAAEQTRNQAEFLKQARILYPLLKDYEAKKTPFGHAALLLVLANKPPANGQPDGFDKAAFQAEALADLLAQYDPAAPSPWLEALCDAAVRVQADRGFGRIPAQYRNRTLALNAVFEKALLDLLAKDKFAPALFEMFRGTRMGDNWSAKDRGEAVLAALIEKRALERSPYRPHDSLRSATCSLQWLIRNEFPRLNEKYPVERFFDDLFVEEAGRTKLLDWRYWDFGLDEKKKVVNAAARLLQTYDVLPPLGEPGTLSRAEFWNWQARALGAEPQVRDAMVARLEAAYGTTRFDTYAMGRAWFATATPPANEAARKDFFARLAAYCDKVRTAPERLSPPFLGHLEKLVDPKTVSKAELDTLLSVFPSTWLRTGAACVPPVWPERWGFDTLASVLAQGLIAQGRPADLYPLVPHLWKIARDTRSATLQHELARLAAQLVEPPPAEAGPQAADLSDLGLLLASVGLDLLKTDLLEDTRSTLAALRSKTLSRVGSVIPVKRDDRRYPLYAAQVAFLSGRQPTAWELALGHRQVLLSMVRELDPSFTIWLIGQYTEAGEHDAAEALARQMIQWFDSVADGFAPETRARLLLAYAGIALGRAEFPKARALFERVATAKEFEGTPAQADAEIRVAEVDRLTRRFDEATRRLERLTHAKDRALQAEAFYQLALVRFDQEEFREALAEIDQVLSRAPDHALARILQGRTLVRLRKLEEPTEIQVGTATQRRFIVPGKPLKVNLEDHNLAVVGAAAHIEIRAWTDSGDEELFTLAPFGDSKTKFVGQVPTELAPAAKGDGRLQLLGDDTARYDYSEAFKKAHNIALAAPQALRVATDGELLASSGRILSKEEREARALEEMIRQRLGDRDEPKEEVALSTVRAANQIKPGNKINIRVVDPDRSTTAGKDSVAVRISTTSGDAIPAFLLTETDTHSGVFEGAVPTTSGQPTAFASDSQDGADPNFAISPRKPAGQDAAEYPSWVALPDSVAPKFYSIDLNDNVALGTMTVLANVPGRKLKSFLVQTSLNGRDFVTQGQWPGDYKPWDGSLRLELVRFSAPPGAAPGAPPASLAEFTQYLDTGHLRSQAPKVTLAPKAFAAKWDASLEGHAQALGLADDGPASTYVAHLVGAFYQPQRKARTLEIDTKDKTQGIRYFLTLDGQPGDTPTHVRRSLAKGVHRVDLYVAATRKAEPAFELLVDSEEPPFLRPAPPDMFEAAKSPQVAASLRTEPAKVSASQNNAAFQVAFPADTRARVIRLALTAFETDAPAIHRITLTNAAGETVLPTREDFATLRRNQVLEIVPGDRVTVAYDDPRALTEGRDTHEATLTATFSNATLSACFVEFEGEGAARRPRYIPMRRFKPGDRINVFIHDPDCDTTEKPDTVKFTAKSASGKAVEMTALETAPHSGIFVGALFPVAAAPQRESELQVAPGDDVTLAYLDRENTDPGIPWERTCLVEQTVFEPPQLRIYEVASRPLTEQELQAAAASAAAPAAPAAQAQAVGGSAAPATQEFVPATRAITASWPERAAADASAPQPEQARPASVLIHGPVIVEVLFPYIAQSPESTATLYVQTGAGRKALGGQAQGPFDPRAPGTLRLQARPSNATAAAPAPPPGYQSVAVKGNPFAGDALEDGRFTFAVPTELAKLPERSLVTEDPDAREKPALAIQGGDEIFVGLEYKDPAGQTRWQVARATLGADAFFDITDPRCREIVEGVFVGESLCFRVIDPARDTTDDKDSVSVEIETASGAKQKLELSETFTHSGVFKATAKVVFRDDKAEAKEPGALRVSYGDRITAAYARAGGQERLERAVAIHKGSDGDVVPFTKQFADPQIAVQTQFSMAEAYFELAKRHRELGQEALARDEIAQGKKLLEEAIRDFPDTEARAQADYLLADLALEFANESKEEEARKKHYAEAVTRFTDIVATYPDSPYAPKAQYKKALAFEKMGMIDQACEEYVKLSYRYPDNELVAETIARLGQYFLSKGKELRAQVTPEATAVEREKIEMRAREMYKTAAQVFGRLAVRFPTHRLAGRTLVLSAQCYMQAEEFPKAIEVFKTVTMDAKMEPELLAEAMYWWGDCYTKQKDSVNAYRVLKRLTWDYPASKWAKFARGRLTEDALIQAGEADEKK